MQRSPSINDTAALKAHLLAQLPRLVDCLFAGRVIHRAAHEIRIGTHGSVSVRLADGSYFNHETGEGGDLFTLIGHALKSDFKSALVFARGFIGHAPLPPIPPAENLQKKQDERAARQRDTALAMLKRAEPVTGTLADAYLQKHRGITLSPLPAALGFIAHAYNYTAGEFYPALIATVRNPAGDAVAAHCTFLDAAGNKLQGESIKPRLIFGACRGGAIRLAAATEKLALCEGIEDGLSVMQCSPEWPVWATGGTSGLRAVPIPAQVREVMICADRDAAGMAAANDLSARLIAEGRRVRIAAPPEGVKDFNDLLRGGMHHVD